MDAEQPLGCLAAHRVRDGGAHVAALGDVARVAEAVHQLRPRAGDAAGLPAELGRLAREAVAGQGRQHQVECVLGAAAVRGRVGQRADDLQQLDDRARPAVRHDQRQRVLVRRPHVDEVDVDPVDLGRELRQRVQPRLARAPVVVGRPVAGELLDRRQLHALRAIGDQLPGGQACRGDAAAELGELLLRDVDLERADRGRVGLGAGARSPGVRVVSVGKDIGRLLAVRLSRRELRPDDPSRDSAPPPHPHRMRTTLHVLVERGDSAHVQPRVPGRLSDPQDHGLAGGAAHDHARCVGVHVVHPQRGRHAASSASGPCGGDVEGEDVRQATCGGVAVESAGLRSHGALLPSIALVALLEPRVAVVVVAVGLPEARLVLGDSCRPRIHFADFQKYRCGTSSRAGPPWSGSADSPRTRGLSTPAHR